MGQSPQELGLRPDLSLLPAEVLDLIRDGSRNGHLGCSEIAVTVCVAMLRAKHGVDQFWMVMTDPANGISKSFFEKDGEQGEAWLERIVCEA